MIVFWRVEFLYGSGKKVEELSILSDSRRWIHEYDCVAENDFYLGPATPLARARVLVGDFVTVLLRLCFACSSLGVPFVASSLGRHVQSYYHVAEGNPN